MRSSCRSSVACFASIAPAWVLHLIFLFFVSKLSLPPSLQSTLARLLFTWKLSLAFPAIPQWFWTSISILQATSFNSSSTSSWQHFVHLKYCGMLSFFFFFFQTPNFQTYHLSTCVSFRALFLFPFPFPFPAPTCACLLNGFVRLFLSFLLLAASSSIISDFLSSFFQLCQLLFLSFHVFHLRTTLSVSHPCGVNFGVVEFLHEVSDHCSIVFFVGLPPCFAGFVLCRPLFACFFGCSSFSFANCSNSPSFLSLFTLLLLLHVLNFSFSLSTTPGAFPHRLWQIFLWNHSVR